MRVALSTECGVPACRCVCHAAAPAARIANTKTTAAARRTNRPPGRRKRRRFGCGSMAKGCGSACWAGAGGNSCCQRSRSDAGGGAQGSGSGVGCGGETMSCGGRTESRGGIGAGVDVGDPGGRDEGVRPKTGRPPGDTGRRGLCAGREMPSIDGRGRGCIGRRGGSPWFGLISGPITYRLCLLMTPVYRIYLVAARNAS